MQDRGRVNAYPRTDVLQRSGPEPRVGKDLESGIKNFTTARITLAIGAAFAGWFRRGPGLRQVILRGLTASRADAIHCDLTDARATLSSLPDTP